MQFTSLGSWLNHMPATLARYGVDGQALLLEFGVSPRADRLPTQVTAQAWCQAANRSGDPAIALRAASYVDAESWGPLGRAIRFCATLEQALQLVTQCPGYLSTSVSITLEARLEGLALITRPLSGELPGHESMEFGMAAGFQILRAAYRAPLSLVSLRQTRPAPEDPTPWREHYGCSQIHFGCPWGEQVYAWQDVRRPLPDANPEQLTNTCRQLQGQPLGAYDPFQAQVESSILGALSQGLCDQRSVAETLHISCRQLQRQLRQRNQTFSGLVEQLRAAQAARLLCNPANTLNEIALQLGFSDHSNFSRAFRRWYGCAPSEFRLQRF